VANSIGRTVREACRQIHLINSKLLYHKRDLTNSNNGFKVLSSVHGIKPHIFSYYKKQFSSTIPPVKQANPLIPVKLIAEDSLDGSKFARLMTRTVRPIELATETFPDPGGDNIARNHYIPNRVKLIAEDSLDGSKLLAGSSVIKVTHTNGNFSLE
jgi:hypothetical protein